MAAFTGPSISELPGWRVGVLFLIFFTVACAYDQGITALDDWLKARRKVGLRRVLRNLQRELGILGLLSLLLAATEAYLLQICISCSGTTCSWDCQPVPGNEEEGGTRRRHLLASDAVDQLSCAQAAETCSPGSEPFWSQLSLIQAHIFLFVVAVVHIIYAAASMLLCLWKLKCWNRFEQHARNHDLQPIRSRFLPRAGDNAFTHTLRCMASVLTGGVNEEVYCGLRRLFCERLDVDRSFDFFRFLVESMEEEFSHVVGINIVLWLLVLLWIMLPSQAYHMFWLSGFSVVAVLIVGIKLQSIVISLAQDAYRVYGSPDSESPAPTVLKTIKLGLKRISGQIIKAPANLAGNVLGSTDDLRSGSGDGKAQDISTQGSNRICQQQQQQQQQLASALDSAADTAAELAVEGAAVQAAGQHAPCETDASQEGGGDGSAQPASGHTLQQHAASEGAWVQRQRQFGEHHRVHKFDLEAGQPLRQAGTSPADATRSSATCPNLLQRCCPWLSSDRRSARQQRLQAARAALRTQSFSETYRGPDAAQLFWFGKPRVLLRIVQAIYFENSLSVAAVLFSVWQHVELDWSQYGSWPLLVGMLALAILVLLFMSLAVLPIYALTTAVGSHSAESVIQLALKRNIKPDIARALQRMSAQPLAAPEFGEQQQLQQEPTLSGNAPAAPQHDGRVAPLAGAVPDALPCGGRSDPAAAISVNPAVLSVRAWAEPPLPEPELERQSMSRLVGAMYQRQLQRHLERSSGRSLAGLGGAAETQRDTMPNGSSSSSTIHRQLSRSSYAGPQAAAQPDLPPEDAAAAASCPAAVGNRWLRQLQVHLKRGTVAADVPASPSNEVNIGRPPAGACGNASSRSSDTGHATLDHVRRLFDAAAEGAGSSEQSFGRSQAIGDSG
ncbi:hypothetical protein D9Q98_000247 [Chlorella vulgaris]|uniref:MLO-like protein n=1 Tax=Chlorella vulgaris TaxID=3077 RepID=A0A9D4Z1G1_CHLVU|nr:hypothetical protein D9Q98_000247 [Chlorella vulgaris]